MAVAAVVVQTTEDQLETREEVVSLVEEGEGLVLRVRPRLARPVLVVRVVLIMPLLLEAAVRVGLPVLLGLLGQMEQVDTVVLVVEVEQTTLPRLVERVEPVELRAEAEGEEEETVLRQVLQTEEQVVVVRHVCGRFVDPGLTLPKFMDRMIQALSQEMSLRSMPPCRRV